MHRLFSFRSDTHRTLFNDTTMKAIKRLIEAVRHINGKRLCEATGITLAIAFFLATIIFLANHAPAFLLIIAGLGFIVLTYHILTMLEE